MFSFIIPCFNDIDALLKTIKSFTWQTKLIPFEIILIDNNSDKEDINEIYNLFYKKLPIYLIKQPVLNSTYSLSKARNIGLSISTYPWIITLDSDIILNPMYMENLFYIINGKENNLIITGERIFIDIYNINYNYLSPDILKTCHPVSSASNYYLEKDRRLPYLKEIEYTKHPWAYMHGGNCIFSKSDALKIKGFDESFDGHWGYEDIDFAYRLITQSSAIPSFNEGLFTYHQERQGKTFYDNERFDKTSNPNWTRICNNILGFKEHKEQEYSNINKLIRT